MTRILVFSLGLVLATLAIAAVALWPEETGPPPDAFGPKVVTIVSPDGVQVLRDWQLPEDRDALRLVELLEHLPDEFQRQDKKHSIYMIHDHDWAENHRWIGHLQKTAYPYQWIPIGATVYTNRSFPAVQNHQGGWDSSESLEGPIVLERVRQRLPFDLPTSDVMEEFSGSGYYGRIASDSSGSARITVQFKLKEQKDFERILDHIDHHIASNPRYEKSLWLAPPEGEPRIYRATPQVTTPQLRVLDRKHENRTLSFTLISEIRSVTIRVFEDEH